MSKGRWAVTLGIVAATVLVTGSLLVGQPAPAGGAPGPQRLVIKVCNWDGVVPEAALDGFTMPGGKWVDFQKDGWQVESYLVAPNEGGGKNGFYAVLKK